MNQLLYRIWASIPESGCSRTAGTDGGRLRLAARSSHSVPENAAGNDATLAPFLDGGLWRPKVAVLKAVMGSTVEYRVQLTRLIAVG